MFKLSSKQYQLIFRIVQISAVSVFLGRAYQHLFWEAPCRALLWEDGWMQWLVESTTKMSWKEYATSPEVNRRIQNVILTHGYFYLFCALVAIFIKQLPKWAGKILLLGSTALIFLATLYMKEKFFHVGQFFEYSLQFLSPIFLYYLVHRDELKPRVWLIMKVAIALTFTCHGLYALAYYPRPGVFTTMTMNILGVGEATAVSFLQAAGVLDFVVSIGIFLPWLFAKYSLGYAIFWGFGTAIARVWGQFYLQFWESTLHQYTFESVMRFPHFLIPLAVLFYYQYKNREKLQNN
jgi:hypothetical protein